MLMFDMNDSHDIRDERTRRSYRSKRRRKAPSLYVGHGDGPPYSCVQFIVHSDWNTSLLNLCLTPFASHSKRTMCVLTGGSTAKSSGTLLVHCCIGNGSPHPKRRCYNTCSTGMTHGNHDATNQWILQTASAAVRTKFEYISRQTHLSGLTARDDCRITVARSVATNGHPVTNLLPPPGSSLRTHFDVMKHPACKPCKSRR